MTANASPELPKPSKREEKLHSLLLEFNPASKTLPSVEKLKECISALQDSTQSLVVQASAPLATEGEEMLKTALLNRVVVSLYGSVMDTFLAEAREADDEAEWWATIERSKTELVFYMIQSMLTFFSVFQLIYSLQRSHCVSKTSSRHSEHATFPWIFLLRHWNASSSLRHPSVHLYSSPPSTHTFKPILVSFFNLPSISHATNVERGAKN